LKVDLWGTLHLTIHSPGKVNFNLKSATVEEAEVTSLKEEKRLIAVVSLINYSVEIVPRGAYYRDSNLKICVNPSFKGKMLFVKNDRHDFT
jgi:hypothetical protein